MLNEYWSAKSHEEYVGMIYQMVQLERIHNDLICEPHVVMRPEVTKDGNAWLCIYGDLPTGVVGCGETPEKACADFDRAWRNNK